MEIWPPSYKIARHKRARYVKLRTAKQGGLKITVPYRFNVKAIPDILEANKTWIIQQLQAQRTECFPDQVVMQALNEHWTIYHMPSLAKPQLLQRPHDREVVLVGSERDKGLLKKILINWLKDKARLYLMAQLQAMSHQTQLPYQQVTIRNQETRWGSCTLNKTISLNYKLIFLPAFLVTHVLLHELCHTVHLNHSDAFWRLVNQYDPHWQEHRRLLRQANQFIPSWL